MTAASAPLGADTITFQAVDDFAAGAVVLGNLNQLAFQYAPGEANNGIDDNGNGLIDEGGLAFEVVGRELRMWLALQRPGPGGSVIAETPIPRSPS